MTRLLTALMLSGLMALAQSSPQNSTASPAPTPSSQNQTQEPTGNLTPKGSTLSNVIKVCGPQSPPPCATAPQLVQISGTEIFQGSAQKEGSRHDAIVVGRRRRRSAPRHQSRALHVLWIG